jgi:lysophospholipase L1-like esterase
MNRKTLQLLEHRLEPLVIVALGDSTTAASDWSDQPGHVYAQLLPAALAARGIPARVYNAGIGGDTTRGARSRLDRDVIHHLPDLVIIQFGINDSWIDAETGQREPPVTRREFCDNLRYIVQTLQAGGAQAILMTPNPMRWTDSHYIEVFQNHTGLMDTRAERGINRLLDIYAQDVRDTARELGFPLVDVHRAFEDYGSTPGNSILDLLVAGDGIHPNTNGQRLVGCLLVEQIAALYGD